jgi:hypothetical protein
MKRAHAERLHTVHVWRTYLSWHGPGPLACRCEFQIGRFRKGQRIGGVRQGAMLSLPWGQALAAAKATAASFRHLV